MTPLSFSLKTNNSIISLIFGLFCLSVFFFLETHISLTHTNFQRIVVDLSTSRICSKIGAPVVLWRSVRLSLANIFANYPRRFDKLVSPQIDICSFLLLSQQHSTSAHPGAHALGQLFCTVCTERLPISFLQ